MTATRQDRLDAIARNPEFDVVVVGGGVNGIGVFRELGLQGLRVLLVERNDYSSGCSAAPSRMIHGGLRYLENGEFDLVRESLRERDALLANAAHMVQPLPTVIPITSIFSGILNSASSFLGRSGKPSNRGMLPIKMGLSLYDWVTRKRRILPRHHFNSSQKTHRKWPLLTSKARFSAVYYDASISHPERLCIEMIADTEKSAPSCIALNYAELSSAGDSHFLVCGQNGRQVQVRPRTIVNATGAWVDSTARDLGADTSEKMVAGTKGSHLIISNHRLRDALAGHMVYFENADGRICIAFPYQGHVLAGSTDIRVNAAGKVRCEEGERAYIIDSLRLVFPDVPVSQSEVVFSYSGIRPLPKSDQDFTGRISRGHYTKRLPGNVPQFCMIGGKWTTFRAFAEQTTNEVLRELGQNRRCDTLGLAIGGGRDFPSDASILSHQLQADFGIGPDRIKHLIAHYGSASSRVQEACDDAPGDNSLCEGSVYSRSEIAYLIRTEQVETLSDIVLRRTGLAITGAISSSLIDELAQILACERGLTEQQSAVQKNQLIEELSDYFGVTPDMLAQRSKERSKQCA